MKSSLNKHYANRVILNGDDIPPNEILWLKGQQNYQRSKFEIEKKFLSPSIQLVKMGARTSTELLVISEIYLIISLKLI